MSGFLMHNINRARVVSFVKLIRPGLFCSISKGRSVHSDVCPSLSPSLSLLHRLLLSPAAESRAPSPGDRSGSVPSSRCSHGGAVSPLRRGLAGLQRIQGVLGRVRGPPGPAQLQCGRPVVGGPGRFLRPGPQLLRGDLQLQVHGGPRPRLRREADSVFPELQHGDGEHRAHQTHLGGQLPERRRVSGTCLVCFHGNF